jgi:hypothetical protein
MVLASLSCRKFRDNEVRLQLHALAYNLATFLRCIELPEAMADWSLTSLQLKLIKIGARVVRHARAITFQLAEVAVTGPMVRAILAAIRRLRAPPLMRMTAIRTQTERKRQDRSIRCAEKHRRWARTQRLRGLIRPVTAACATPDAAWGKKRLSRGRIQAIFTSVGTPLGADLPNLAPVSGCGC